LHVRLSWNAVLLGGLDQAEAFARIALNADPGNAAAYYQLARVFVLQGQPDNAATVLATGLNASYLDPTSIRADTVLIRIAEHPDLRSLLGQ
jgi:thioredoxin-like negative regulator of GroEL